jgi:hypothetical protein
MALWEYKIITSGAHGFANPSLLEKHLNTLGKDEWEIIHFQTQPDNPLAFHGLARRSTQRDWTPPEMPSGSAGAPSRPAGSLFDTPPPASSALSMSSAPSAPPAPLMSSAPLMSPASRDQPAVVSQASAQSSMSPTPSVADLPASPSAAMSPAAAASASPPSDGVLLGGAPLGAAPSGAALSAAAASAIAPSGAVADDKSAIRPVRDTERDLDPDAPDESDDDWDNLDDMDDDLPTFFDALKPHFRRNLKGPGASVSIEFLAKRWEQREADLLGALKECGLTIPETEEADPEYFEFEEDLYWVNRNNRGQLFINTREKPRPVFRIVQATPLSPDDPAAAELAAEREAEKAGIEKRKAERAARQAAAETAAAARAEEAARRRAAREAAAHETAAQERADDEAAGETGDPRPEPTPPGDDTPPPAAPAPAGPLPEGEALLAKIRPMMRRNRRAPGYSGSISFLARALHEEEETLAAALAALGLRPPATAGEKPVFVEIENGLYWLNKDNRGGIWINGRDQRPRPPESPIAAPADPTPADSATAGPSATDPSATADPSAAGPAAADPAIADPAATSKSGANQAAPDAPAAPVSPAGGTIEAGPTAEPPPSGKAAAPVADAASSPAVLPGIDLNRVVSNDTAPAKDAAPAGNLALSAVRLLLKPNKRGSGVSGETGFLARALDKPEDGFMRTLTATGLVVPDDSEQKPVFVEHDGEIYWFSKYPKDGTIWLNAKPAKSAAKKKPTARTRSKNN